jgi:MOSC domain-containing protein YiiM
MSRDRHAVTMAEIARLYSGQGDDFDLLQRAVQIEALPEGWREHFQQQIQQLNR